MNNKINLPLFETVRRSFMCVLKNFSVVTKISSIFIFLWLACIVMEIQVAVSPNVTFEQIWRTELWCALLTALASTIVAVSFIRYIVLKQTPKWFGLSFGMNNIKFIGWNIVLFLFVFLPSSFIGAGAAIAEYNGTDLSVVRSLGLTAMILILVMFVYVGRLYLVYASSALGVKNFGLAKSFALTKGNTLKILCGSLILVIPTVIFTHLLVRLYQLPNLNIIGVCVLSLLSMAVSFFDSAVKASYYSHLYQFFTYFDKEKPTQSAIAVEKTIVETKPAEKKTVAKKTVKKPAKKSGAKKPVAKSATKKTTATSATPKVSKAAVKKTPATKKTVVKKKPAALKKAAPKPQKT